VVVDKTIESQIDRGFALRSRVVASVHKYSQTIRTLFAHCSQGIRNYSQVFASIRTAVTVKLGLRENRTQEGTHRFYRFPHAAARPHAPFLSGAAVSIDQM